MLKSYGISRKVPWLIKTNLVGGFQPIWKILLKNWIISRNRGEHLKENQTITSKMVPFGTNMMRYHVYNMILERKPTVKGPFKFHPADSTLCLPTRLATLCNSKTTAYKQTIRWWIHVLTDSYQSIRLMKTRPKEASKRTIFFVKRWKTLVKRFCFWRGRPFLYNVGVLWSMCGKSCGEGKKVRTWLRWYEAKRIFHWVAGNNILLVYIS